MEKLKLFSIKKSSNRNYLAQLFKEIKDIYPYASRAEKVMEFSS